MTGHASTSRVRTRDERTQDAMREIGKIMATAQTEMDIRMMKFMRSTQKAKRP